MSMTVCITMYIYPSGGAKYGTSWNNHSLR